MLEEIAYLREMIDDEFGPWTDERWGRFVADKRAQKASEKYWDELESLREFSGRVISSAAQARAKKVDEEIMRMVNVLKSQP